MSFFNDADDEEIDEVECEREISYDFNGKVYTSAETLRRELSTQDLIKVLNDCSLKLTKYKKQLKRADIKFNILSTLVYVGVACLVLKGFACPILKNVANFLAPATLSVGVIGKLLNIKKYTPIEVDYENISYLGDEVHKELYSRKVIEYNKQREKEIFSDIFGEVNL